MSEGRECQEEAGFMRLSVVAGLELCSGNGSPDSDASDTAVEESGPRSAQLDSPAESRERDAVLGEPPRPGRDSLLTSLQDAHRFGRSATAVIGHNRVVFGVGVSPPGARDMAQVRRL